MAYGVWHLTNVDAWLLYTGRMMDGWMDWRVVLGWDFADTWMITETMLRPLRLSTLVCMD